MEALSLKGGLPSQRRGGAAHRAEVRLCRSHEQRPSHLKERFRRRSAAGRSSPPATARRESPRDSRTRPPRPLSIRCNGACPWPTRSTGSSPTAGHLLCGGLHQPAERCLARGPQGERESSHGSRGLETVPEVSTVAVPGLGDMTVDASSEKEVPGPDHTASPPSGRPADVRHLTGRRGPPNCRRRRGRPHGRGTRVGRARRSVGEGHACRRPPENSPGRWRVRSERPTPSTTGRGAASSAGPRPCARGPYRRRTQIRRWA